MALTRHHPNLVSTTVTGNRTGTNLNAQLGEFDANFSLNRFRNYLYNPEFTVNQRGSLGVGSNLPSAISYVNVDRWAFQQSSAAGTSYVNQISSSGLTGFTHMLQVGRNNASSATGRIRFGQVLETLESTRLAGKTVTISFWARKSATFTPSGSILNVILHTGTGTNEPSSLAIAGNLTGGANALVSGAALTTSWVRYSFTGTVSSTATQICALFYFDPVGTAPDANDYLQITGVQLEEGLIATGFERRPGSFERNMCERYYEIGSGSWSGNTTSGSSYFYRLPFRALKRATPTVTLTNNSASGFATTVGSTVADQFSFTETRASNATVSAGSFTSTYAADAEL